MHPNYVAIMLIAWGILAVGIALGYFLRRSSDTPAAPGPDTRIQRALKATEGHQQAIRPSQTPMAGGQAAAGPGRVPVPTPPRQPYYEQLRRSADARLLAELPTDEIPVVPPQQTMQVDIVSHTGEVVDTIAIPVLPSEPEPVSTGADGELIGLSIDQLMRRVMADATQRIPRFQAEPVPHFVPDRRVHAELPDGSEVVRYERAGKWFHEGPGLRAKLTLGQAAVLATGPGARPILGLPGGQLFDLRVDKAREQAAN